MAPLRKKTFRLWLLKQGTSWSAHLSTSQCSDRVLPVTLIESASSITINWQKWYLSNVYLTGTKLSLQSTSSAMEEDNHGTGNVTSTSSGTVVVRANWELKVKVKWEMASLQAWLMNQQARRTIAVQKSWRGLQQLRRLTDPLDWFIVWYLDKIKKWVSAFENLSLTAPLATCPLIYRLVYNKLGHLVMKMKRWRE